MLTRTRQQIGDYLGNKTVLVRRLQQLEMIIVMIAHLPEINLQEYNVTALNDPQVRTTFYIHNDIGRSGKKCAVRKNQ